MLRRLSLRKSNTLEDAASKALQFTIDHLS